MRAARDALERAQRPLTRTDGESEQLGDGGQLGHDAALTCADLATEQPVRDEDAREPAHADQHEQGDRRRAARGCQDQRECEARGEPERPGDHLAGAELFDGLEPAGPYEPPSELRGGRADPRHEPDPVGEHGSDESLEDRHRPAHDGRTEQPRAGASRPQVGREPLVERDPACAHTRDHDEHATRREQPRERALHDGAHRSTRGSSGSRATRSMAAYAITVHVAPVSSTTNPAGVS